MRKLILLIFLFTFMLYAESVKIPVQGILTDSSGIVLKECENSCENNQCIENETCNPACKDWEVCEGTICKLQFGKCNTEVDCSDSKICDDTHTCVDKSNDCNPACKGWENCIEGSCSLQEGRCNIDTDCKDNQKCENNSCIDKIIKKKTKISLGANQKMNSSNFKLKLNLGKMKTSKDMKSTDYKLKLTSGIK